MPVGTLFAQRIRLTTLWGYWQSEIGVLEGANRVPIPSRTKYRRQRTRDPAGGGILFAGSRGCRVGRLREQSTDPIRAHIGARTETPATTSSLGAVMRVRTEYRQVGSKKLAANTVPTRAAANRVPTSAIDSPTAASLSELFTISRPPADPSPTYFVAQSGDSGPLRGACGS